MPAIVRVKRRIDEEPLNAFVLNGKKRRLDNLPQNESQEEVAAGSEGSEEITTVLKFAGTINELDNTATTHFAQRINKEDARQLVQGKSARRAGNHTERARQETRQSQHENRFRVVNCLRTTLTEDKESLDEARKPQTDKDDVKSLTIVDIEKQTNETENQSPMGTQQPTLNPTTPADSDTGYVYDLYLPDDDVQARNADLMDDNYLSVRAVSDLVFEDAYNDAEDEDYDSEDSNREDYFTNEYPDEDDDDEEVLHSANEYGDEEDDVREMRRAVENFVFGDDDDEDGTGSEADVYDDASSSDDNSEFYAYEDPYVQSIDVENDNFVPDIDTYDLQSVEASYDRYSKRLLKRLGKAESEDEDEFGDDYNDESNDAKKGALNASSELEMYHSADEKD